MNQDFYPTPKKLIRKMLEGVDADKLSTVLEPSAGRGNICDYISELAYGSRRAKIDVIEIDGELQYALKGKEYNLIYDDFLTFDTSKIYDLIIANFPFSEGDRHLQRALFLLEKNGGNLVCLVNAETLKNPFTNLRETVLATLTKHDAHIEYLQGEFVDAERRTNVEVALVRVSIEKVQTLSLILDSLTKANKVDLKGNIENKLIEKDFLKALISCFNVECDIGIRLIEEYFSLKPYMTERLKRSTDDFAGDLIELKIDGAYGDKTSFVNSYLSGVRHKFWELLLNDPRFNSDYTSNILKELNQKLEKLREYDFNLFNVRQLEKELGLKIVAGIETSILQLFDELSRKYAYGDDFSEGNIHYYNGWKTNKAHKINAKVIVPMNGFSAWAKDRLDYYVRERLSDMVKVFNYLSGGLEDVDRLVGHTIKEADSAHDFSSMDLRYFETTFYKKGTCHIRFKDDKLLEKFNIYGSQRKGWLPPSYGRKAYREMDPEERRVVDEFQGEEKYNEVVKDTDFYLKAESPKLLN